MSVFQERTKKLLKKERKTIDQLADAVHRNRATVYRYMNGTIETIPADAVKLIADFLHTNPAYLMGWIDDPRSSDVLFDALMDEENADRLDEAYTIYTLAEHAGKAKELIDIFVQLMPDEQEIVLRTAKAFKGSRK